MNGFRSNLDDIIIWSYLIVSGDTLILKFLHDFNLKGIQSRMTLNKYDKEYFYPAVKVGANTLTEGQDMAKEIQKIPGIPVKP